MMKCIYTLLLILVGVHGTQLEAMDHEQDPKNELEEEREQKALKAAEDLIFNALAGEKLPHWKVV